MFDVNSDGMIEYNEFVETLVTTHLGMTEQQMYELMVTIDKNQDSHINFVEFASRFQVVFTEMKSVNTSSGLAVQTGMPHVPLTPHKSWRAMPSSLG